jgi:hypothetical protein
VSVPTGAVERDLFDDEPAARKEAARRNALERDWRWSHWWAQPRAPNGTAWVVMRVRMVGPQEVGMEPRQFEQILRDKLGDDPNRVSEFPAGWTRGGGPRPYWEGLAGLHMESVELEGCCPHTALVLLFRLVDHPDLLFGQRNPIWPAESADPGFCAAQFEIYLMEDVGRALKRAAAIGIGAEAAEPIWDW